jgi:hypothetical protein
MIIRRYKLVWATKDGEVQTINISKSIFESWHSRLNHFAKQMGMEREWDFTINEITRIY